jgi:signal transduction histidine kinase
VKLSLFLPSCIVVVVAVVHLLLLPFVATQVVVSSLVGALATATLLLLALRRQSTHAAPATSALKSASTDSMAEWRDVAIADERMLSGALDAVVRHVHSYFAANRVSLVLFGSEGHGERASYSIGQNIGAPSGSESLVSLVEPLLFAGEQLGSLTVVGEENGTLEQPERLRYLRSMAREAVMLLINARYLQDFIKVKRRLLRDSEEKRGFLAGLSHELRGPLGIIVNATEVLAGGMCGPISDEQREALDMVRLNGKHLLDLMTDVLDFARAEQGSMRSDAEPLDVHAEVCQVVQMMRSDSDRKKHALRYREPSVHQHAMCDRKQFRQVLLNLLSNAVKYTPDGGAIEVWIEESSAQNIRVCVRDSGIGIADEDRARVFMPFERLDHPYATMQQGAGVGLSLSQKLSALNRGEIDFSSEVGFGTTFWVDLPRADASDIASGVPASSNEVVRGSGELIVMVYPGEEERTLVSRYLLTCGFEVAFVSHATELRSTLKREKLGLVLLVDGPNRAELAATIDIVRREPRSVHTPVMLLTTRAFLIDVEEYLRLGVDRCLAKPIGLHELAIAAQQMMALSASLATRRDS